MGYDGLLYCKLVDGSMFSVHNCTNTTFEYEIVIKFDDTIIGYFENPDVATTWLLVTNIPNHLA